ncbi:MAG TPA: DUF748 domain-containing protein, partial [Burkholderiaceae bacterium]|nr:DUF748 domain-containing protein [Burkholderiaceae bacterium]
MGGGASTGGPRWRRRLLRAAIVLAVLVALYAALGFLLVPWIARGQIEKQLGAQLDRQASVGKVTFNPFKLDASVQDLLVRDRDGSSPFVQFARLDVDMSWRSLTALAPVLAGLRLVEPKVALRREPDGRYNFQDLIDKWSNQPAGEDGPTPHFSLSNIVLENGRVDFDDRAKDSRHAVSAINIGVPFISSLPVHEELFVEPHVSAEVDGSRFAADGKTRPFEPDRPSTLRIDLDAFDLLRVVPYSPVPLPVVLKSGRLTLANTVEFSQPPDGTPHVRVTGDVRLDDLDVTEKGGEPLLKFGSLAAEGLTFTLVGRRLELRRLALQSPQVVVQRRAGQTQFFESVLAGIKPAGKEAAGSAGKEPAGKEPTGKEPAGKESAGKES